VTKIQFEKVNGSTILNYSLEMEVHSKNPENGRGKYIAFQYWYHFHIL